MNGRQRFLETMQFGHPDRVPYFEEGIRDDVLKAWRKQGLAADADLGKMFISDLREEIDLDVYPHPWPRNWPVKPPSSKPSPAVSILKIPPVCRKPGSNPCLVGSSATMS